MNTFLILNGKRMEVLDQMAVFEESEKVVIDHGDGTRSAHTVGSVNKVLTGSGDKYDVSIEVQLI